MITTSAMDHPGSGRYVAFAYNRDDQAKPTATGGNHIMRRSDSLDELRVWAAARFAPDGSDREVIRVRIFNSDDLESPSFTKSMALEVIERPGR